MDKECEKVVKQKFPDAAVMSGEIGGKTFYRIENKTGPRRHRALSAWKDTEEQAWVNARGNIAEKGR